MYFNVNTSYKKIMITSKKDYVEYLKCDKLAIFGQASAKYQSSFYPFHRTYKFLKVLRFYEYVYNCKKGKVWFWLRIFAKIRYNMISSNTGIQIAPNTFGKGLGIWHWGSIIVNDSAKFGEWCCIQGGVNVSANVRAGDYVYLAPGAKVNNNVELGNNIIVGSNAVVTKSFVQNGITLGGVPAKVISNKGFYG